MKNSIAGVWSLPFKKDPDGYSVYIWDNEHNMCFNYLGNDYALYERIVNLLNGEPAEPFKRVGFNENTIAVSDDEQATEAKPILLVRGWGHLTGRGGLRLSVEEAVSKQNELLEYCARKLKGNA